MLNHLHTVDFETEGIEGNPIVSPPMPVGVSITYPNLFTEYYTGDDMKRKLAEFWGSGCPLLFHNAPFDIRVAEEWLGFDWPHWQRIHDTTYLVYLKDPHSSSLSLKPSAERYLELPPEEQDDLKVWILTNVKQATKKNWGAFICEAPVELVAPYAKGDTIRTRGIFDLLHPQVPEVAYDRERRLMPILVADTIRGVRADREGLLKAHDDCTESQKICEDRIREKLGCETLNPHSGIELAKALDKANAVKGWELTPTGRKSTARANLLANVKEKELLDLLVYTGAMQTVLGTFVEPWIEKSSSTGRLHPNWNQVRSSEARTKGTRTGRLSSDDPNFQNIPNPFDYVIPDGLCKIPSMREYVLPEEGHVWLKRDWSAQEMRILAHYEEGDLMQAYIENPNLDPHQMVTDLIEERVGRKFPRKFIKETGFGMIYGMGAPGLARKIGITTAEARELQQLYNLILPGVRVVQQGTKERGRMGLPITTWGGREYYAEEPRIIGNSYRSFEYKLTNYLIQGSGADQAKQTIIEWNEGKPYGSVFMATVHDEISISAPKEEAPYHMEWLRHCMEEDYFDVPMKSDSYIGENWGSLEEYDYAI